MQDHHHRPAVTLLELVVVLVVLVALASLLLPLMGDSSEDAKKKCTLSTMTQIRDVILGQYRTDMKDDVLFEFRDVRGTSSTIKKRPLVLPRPRFAGSTVDIDGVSPDQSQAWCSSTPNKPSLTYLLWNPGVYWSPSSGDPDPRNTNVGSYRPTAHRGWNGPYFQPAGSAIVVPTINDSWGKPIEITEEDINDAPTGYFHLRCSLVSGGSDGKINTADDNVTLIVEDRVEKLDP